MTTPATLKILNPADLFGIGYPLPGSIELSLFEGLLNSAFDSIVTGDLGDAQFASGADAILVNLVTDGLSYTPAELANLGSILGGATPALVFFENDAWSVSNGQLAPLMGATYLGQTGSTFFSVTGSSPLVEGIDAAIEIATGGRMSGGEQVVADVVTLRGPNDNVILAGDINVYDNDRINGNASNATFAQNTVDFLAVPEPSSALCFVLGSLGMALRRRRQ